MKHGQESNYSESGRRKATLRDGGLGIIMKMNLEGAKESKRLTERLMKSLVKDSLKDSLKHP